MLPVRHTLNAFPPLLAYAAFCAGMIAGFNGTGDSGDSISHYLYARYAPQHPELFFHHWAKPLFVLLASPFAQFGFVGIKVFNALVSGGTLLATYRLAQVIGLRHALLAPVFTWAAPLFLTLTFSGLTEPLFACVLTWALVLAVRERLLAAAILLSFLPFVRSEGLIMLAVFGSFLLLKRQYRMIPWLGLGTLVYGLAGWPVHGTPFWPITAIPYAHVGSPYGSGSAFHFLEQLVHVVGVPLYALLLLGSGAGLWRWWRASNKLQPRFLIGACAWAFLAAHTFFWWAGIFNSMGLNRVVVGIVPLLAVLALGGLEQLLAWLPEHLVRFRPVLLVLLVGYVLLFPVMPNPAAINVDQDLRLMPDQVLAQRTAAQLTMLGDRRIVAQHPYIAVVTGRDPFNGEQWQELRDHSLDALRPDDLIVWDHWFAPVEGGVTREMLETHGWRVLWSGHGSDRGKRVEQVIYGR